MQGNWHKQLIFGFFLALSISGCQSTGSTPWKSSSYSVPAEHPPSILTETLQQPSEQRAYEDTPYPEYPVNNRDFRVAQAQSNPYYRSTITQPDAPSFTYESQTINEAETALPVQNNFEVAERKTEPSVFQHPQPRTEYNIRPANESLTALSGFSTKSKIALLLPLSGENSSIGEALLQSAQMALFDLGANNIELLPRDTKGTPEGARIAAQKALSQGAELVLGPVFASSVKAVKPILSRADINMIAFSTDWSNAGGNAFIMGVMPFTQVNRVTDFMANKGYSRYALVAPRTQYGNVVADAFEARIRENYGELVRLERYSPLDPNVSPLIREFSDFDMRAALREERVQELTARLEIDQDDELAQIELESLENIQTLGELPYEVVMVPVGGKEAKTLVNLLRFYDVDGENIQLIGTGLWDDLGLAKEPAMQGAYFAAPSPRARQFFEQKYQGIYDTLPPRIASLSYDATALAIVLSRNPASNKFSKRALTNPNGFAGIDGIFRLTDNGMVQRGLAVLQIQNGKITVIDPAPTTFEVFSQN